MGQTLVLLTFIYSLSSLDGLAAWGAAKASFESVTGAAARGSATLRRGYYLQDNIFNGNVEASGQFYGLLFTFVTWLCLSLRPKRDTLLAGMQASTLELSSQAGVAMLLTALLDPRTMFDKELGD